MDMVISWYNSPRSTPDLRGPAHIDGVDTGEIVYNFARQEWAHDPVHAEYFNTLRTNFMQAELDVRGDIYTEVMGKVNASLPPLPL